MAWAQKGQVEEEKTTMSIEAMMSSMVAEAPAEASVETSAATGTGAALPPYPHKIVWTSKNISLDVHKMFGRPIKFF